MAACKFCFIRALGKNVFQIARAITDIEFQLQAIRIQAHDALFQPAEPDVQADAGQSQLMKEPQIFPAHTKSLKYLRSHIGNNLHILRPGAGCNLSERRHRFLQSAPCLRNQTSKDAPIPISGCQIDIIQRILQTFLIRINRNAYTFCHASFSSPFRYNAKIPVPDRVPPSPS